MTTTVDTNASANQNKQSIHEMHYAVAEYGKVLALKAKHDEALKHYREAIRMAVSGKAPEIFFRHYTQCVLESLELTKSYGEVIEFCRNADAHYQTIEHRLPLHNKDHASVLERQGINELKAGDNGLALDTLRRAVAVCGKGVLPLSEELINWLQRGLSVDVTRLLALQNKHRYFVVRREQVDPSKARSLDSLPNHLQSGSMRPQASLTF